VGQLQGRRDGEDRHQPRGLRPDVERALETGGVLVGKDVTITLDLQGAFQA
jgi:hypothetical protein